MEETTRTTIRIQADLLNKSRLIAIERKSSVQDVINEILTIGFKHVSDIKSTQESFRKIDKFREKMKQQNINLRQIIKDSKKDRK